MTADEWTIAEQDRSIAEAFTQNETRLRRFIRSRVLDGSDTEDVLQDIFYELIQAYRLMKPAEHLTAWLYRVAKNRITDLFRRRQAVSLNEVSGADEDSTLEDLLPSPEAGPDAIYARNVMLDALDEALEELPAAQRDTFVAHEVEGKSFKMLADETGVPVNTLLARKRAAVLHLRKRLIALDARFGLE